MNNYIITPAQNANSLIAIFEAVKTLGLGNDLMTLEQATAINRAFKNEVAAQFGFDAIAIQ